MGPNALLQDDNARPHRAGIIADHLQHAGVERMEWPSKSPDLNPIEHLWDQLGRAVRARVTERTTLADLGRLLVEEWDATVSHCATGDEYEEEVPCCSESAWLGHPTERKVAHTYLRPRLQEAVHCPDHRLGEFQEAVASVSAAAAAALACRSEEVKTNQAEITAGNPNRPPVEKPSWKRSTKRQHLTSKCI
ncbi:Hypp1108 [Branchiostoma lanceolatum]|uniref:Hypp1108 protein n=1 Tax=Branchiostoma lanceolatum TaxID=7740 RepID=A0A8J9ZGV5_BRALA|nr:Hypp1108 [Branchiostoma lanceolatum]